MNRLFAWLLGKFSPKVWVHGVVRKSTNDGAVWDFLGVYTSPGQARNACQSMNEFFFPARLDVAMDRKLKSLPEIEFPRRAGGMAERSKSHLA